MNYEDIELALSGSDETQNSNGELEVAVGIGEWLLTFLILGFINIFTPLVGTIGIIIWSSKCVKKTKKNFLIAFLIIELIISAILIVVFLIGLSGLKSAG